MSKAWSSARRRSIVLALSLLGVTSTLACREANARPVEGGDANRGKVAIREYGCGSCHTIPGVTGANGLVGPPLSSWSERVYIAGYVPNTTDFLIRWIEVPRAIKPMTAMPNLAVPESDARDIAAYLYTLH
jgi:cytochrome c2